MLLSASDGGYLADLTHTCECEIVCNNYFVEPLPTPSVQSSTLGRQAVQKNKSENPVWVSQVFLGGERRSVFATGGRKGSISEDNGTEHQRAKEKTG